MDEKRQGKIKNKIKKLKIKIKFKKIYRKEDR